MLEAPASFAILERSEKYLVSRFIMATPPSIEANISPLAWAIASTESKNSRCAEAIAVTTATCGRTSRASGFISPGWFIPISKMPYFALLWRRASDSGTPQWLLRLRWLKLVLPWADRTWASASLVPVFPTLPVMAAICAALRSRALMPRAHIADIVSWTTNPGRPLSVNLFYKCGRCSGIKSGPNKLVPIEVRAGECYKRSPWFRVLVSMETPLAAQSSVVPPLVAAAAVIDVQSGVVTCFRSLHRLLLLAQLVSR